MSEHLNNPEYLQPMTDQCSTCEKEYELGINNTFAVEFTKQPECNYFMAKCTHCEDLTKIFCSQDSLERANRQGIVINPDIQLPDGSKRPLGGEYADEHTYNQWCQVKGIELPKTYELTARHEEIIKRFGETITAITEQAPDLFMDVMSDPAPPQTMPQRWI